MICIIGTGYVGLPLAIAFSKYYSVIAYDIDEIRIRQLINGVDKTSEISKIELKNSGIQFTSNVDDVANCEIYIITVPTPVDMRNEPDLKALKNASASVGRYLCSGDTVIYESTVYPGCTEEVCLPILENASGLKLGDFLLGYSPERINPGDKNHTLQNTVKVVSGNSPKALSKISEIYSHIIDVGVYKAQSIKVAEATKLLENVQRDVNIALINEFSQLMRKEEIDTLEVIQAANTKWNFSRYVPGLVGGHCIGVDPYYMIYRAGMQALTAPLISTAREVNESVSSNLASEIDLRLSIGSDERGTKMRILCLGVTFKENCPDYRNSKIVDLIFKLKTYGHHVDVYDPVVDPLKFEVDYGIQLLKKFPSAGYDAVICAVPHIAFRNLSEKEVLNLLNQNEYNLLADLKGAFSFSANSKKFKNILRL